MPDQKYVYRRTEPRLWTVGFYDPMGKWEPESDHSDRQEAARRTSFLNGGGTDCKLEGNAFEQFSKREWAMALVGLTPGGSEFLTPDECVHFVRSRTNYPSIIIELRKQVKALREIVEALGTWFDAAVMEGPSRDSLLFEDDKTLGDKVVEVLEQTQVPR